MVPKAPWSSHEYLVWPRKMQFFHQLDEKMAETFLADVHCKVLYMLLMEQLGSWSRRFGMEAIAL